MGEESSELGSMDYSLNGNDAGGEYDGDLGEWCLGGDDAGGEHDGGIGGVQHVSGSSNIMDWVSM